MSQPTIQPTGTLRAWGWPLIAAGVLVLLIVWPLFAFGTVMTEATGGDGGGTAVVATLAPWLGVAAIAAGVTLVVIAGKRAAANREAAQRATIEAQMRAEFGQASDSV
jgi:membrane protein implicated in regulation of membrane protease activity